MRTSLHRRPASRRSVVFVAVAAGVALGAAALALAPWPELAPDAASSATLALDATGDDDAGAAFFPVHVRRPAGPPMVRVLDGGVERDVSCSTCHSLRAPDPTNRTAADLTDFHVGLEFAHGDLSCLACHDTANADALRLADGSPLAYPDVMTLCAQCHGQKALAYEHGAHGGMTGHWDLARGPRVRNGCTDCHDPHVPAFPRMQPTFKPRDRFLSPPSDDGAHGHAGDVRRDAREVSP